MPHGRTEEAIAELEFALESDPLSMFTRLCLAIMLLLWHRYDRAMEQARVLLELDPTFYWGHFVVGIACREKRIFDEAIAAHRKAVDFSGGSPLMMARPRVSTKRE